MIYCQNCGAQIDENSRFCPVCGITRFVDTTQTATDKSTLTLYTVLSVLFPIAGIILFFINKDKDAVLAKRCLKAALITWAVQIGFSLVVGIGVPLIAIIFGSAVSEVEATTPAIGAALAVTLR